MRLGISSKGQKGTDNAPGATPKGREGFGWDGPASFDWSDFVETLDGIGARDEREGPAQAQLYYRPSGSSAFRAHLPERTLRIGFGNHGGTAGLAPEGRGSSAYCWG